MIMRIESLIYINNLEFLINYLETKIKTLEYTKKENQKNLFLENIINHDEIILFLKKELNQYKQKLEEIDNDEETETRNR